MILHLWQANYRDVMAGSVGLIHPDALSDMLAHSPDLVTDLVAQRSAQMTATRKVRQVGMGQPAQHSMHSRLQNSWIASCFVFAFIAAGMEAGTGFGRGKYRSGKAI